MELYSKGIEMKSLTALFALFFSVSVIAEQHDVGVAGVDYEILVQPDRISVVEDRLEVLKYCGKGTHGCAILGKSPALEDGTRDTVCLVFIQKRYRKPEEKEITLRHEMKHCYGWVHPEMSKVVQRRGYNAQLQWLERNHKNWFSLEPEQLEKLRTR